MSDRDHPHPAAEKEAARFEALVREIRVLSGEIDEPEDEDTMMGLPTWCEAARAGLLRRLFPPVNVYQLVERRRGKVYESVDIAPALDGLARAFARAVLRRAMVRHRRVEADVRAAEAVRPPEAAAGHGKGQRLSHPGDRWAALWRWPPPNQRAWLNAERLSGPLCAASGHR